MCGRRPGSDQYNTFTARLAANGYQTVFTRLFGGCSLGLAFVTAVAAACPGMTDVPGGRVGLAVISVSTVAIAVPWLGDRWPSRKLSAIEAVLASLALSATALLFADPMVGLLVAVGFPYLLGYTAMLHSFRLLVVSATVGAVTVAVLALRVAEDGASTAVVVTVPLVLLSVVGTYACRAIADVGGSALAPAEVEPVTGLLTRDSFERGVATLLGARQRDDDRYLVVVAAGVDGFSAIAGVHGPRGANQVQVEAGQAIRETTRSSAIVGHLGDAEFLIADVTFTIADPAPLVERVLGAIAATPTRMTASVGVVSTPLRPLAQRPPRDVLDEVIALAVAAMAEARTAGGNQARYVIVPTLSGDDVTGDAGY